MIIVHPWMPFITEEIWDQIKQRNTKDRCIVAKWPEVKPAEARMIKEFEVVKELVAQVRGLRQQKQLSPKEKLEVYEKSDAQRSYFDELVMKLANLSAFKYTASKIEGAYSFLIHSTEFFIPLAINAAEEKERLKKELEYNKGFLKSVQVKLANEKFMANAKPELIELEKKKESDALSKINALEEQLKNL
jgi:valyl-tRNA synthetase